MVKPKACLRGAGLVAVHHHDVALLLGDIQAGDGGVVTGQPLGRLGLALAVDEVLEDRRPRLGLGLGGRRCARKDKGGQGGQL
uniref:Uncharacterized protein n=1 Tax=Phenylobacterium glaciei TaxID=2803784 RepID=A0A974S8J1_9CAUL|nr:hypothetical protein JKL49_22775 [Phenylobacterium glaciei]